MHRISCGPTVLGLVLLIASATHAAAQAELRIGYINSAAVYEEAPGAQAAQTLKIISFGIIFDHFWYHF